MRGDLVLCILVVVAVFAPGCVAGEGRPSSASAAVPGGSALDVRGTSEQLYGLGFMEMSNKKYDKALDLFDLAIEKNADDQMMDAAQIYETKGECLRTMGQCEEAVYWYQEALSRNEFLVAATVGLARCADEGVSIVPPEDNPMDEEIPAEESDDDPVDEPTEEPIEEPVEGLEAPVDLPAAEPMLPPKCAPVSSVDLVMQRTLDLSEERWDFDYYVQGAPLVIVYQTSVEEITRSTYDGKKDVMVERNYPNPDAWVKITAYNPDTGEKVEDGYGGGGHYSREPIKEVAIRSEGRYHISIEGRFAVVDVAIWGK